MNLCPSRISSNAEQKRKPTTPKRLPKSKIFPFMKLPAEIRNMIYTYTLTDASGINLVAIFKHRRRAVERISAEAQFNIGGDQYYSINRINDDVRAKYEEPTALVPSLLAVSKQIHQEGRDILYANEFIFADTFALYSFMINLGPAGATYLKKLRLMGWGYGRAMKAYNHSCFATLVWATNLESFRFDKTSGYSRNPKGAAEQLYRDAFPWLEAVGVAKGKVDAALEVLQISEDVFDHPYWHNSQRRTVSGEEGLEKFREGLGRLLGAQQKRIMAKPVKKRKIAKDGVTDEL